MLEPHGRDNNTLVHVRSGFRSPTRRGDERYSGIDRLSLSPYIRNKSKFSLSLMLPILTL
jgi:hypothetical protein